MAVLGPILSKLRSGAQSLERHPALTPKLLSRANLPELGQMAKTRLMTPQVEHHPLAEPQGPMNDLAERYHEVLNRWMQSGNQPEAHQLQAERDLNAAQRDMMHPALEPRDAPVGIRQAYQAAQIRMGQRVAKGTPVQFSTPVTPEPKILPPQPKLEDLGAGMTPPEEVMGRWLNPAKRLLNLTKRPKQP